MPVLAQITSKDNRRLVDLRKLRDGLTRESIFIEGRRLAEEALRSSLKLDALYVSEAFDGDELVEKLIERIEFAAELPTGIFDSIAETRSSQGIIVTAVRPTFHFGDLEQRMIAGSLPLVLLLDQVNNPSNLGAVVRTAEAADAAGVIVTRGSADAYSPKALRAAMGSSLRLPIVTGVDALEAVEWARANGLVLTRTAADFGGNHTDCDWKRRRVLAFGSEAHGVGVEIINYAEDSVRIAMENSVESLNLAVSAGIILFEARRQNG